MHASGLDQGLRHAREDGVSLTCRFEAPLSSDISSSLAILGSVFSVHFLQRTRIALSLRPIPGEVIQKRAVELLLNAIHTH